MTAKDRAIVARHRAKRAWYAVSERLWKRRHTSRSERLSEWRSKRSYRYSKWYHYRRKLPRGHELRSKWWGLYVEAEDQVVRWTKLRDEASAWLKRRREQVAFEDRVVERHSRERADLSVVSRSLLPFRRSGYGLLGPIRAVTVHHSAGPRAETMDEAVATIRAYDAMHARLYGGGIGYHEIVDDAGRVYPVRSRLAKGAHTGGCNSNNYGISFLGNYETDEPTPEQLATLRARLTEAPPKGSGLPDLRGKTVKGHRDWPGPTNATACPGRNLYPHVLKF